MPQIDFEFNALDGLKLHGRQWTPSSESRAVICLVHGLGEHCGRYDPVADRLNQAGYALIACDMRGHGRSGGKRGHAKNYTVLMDDIFQLLEEAKERYPDMPVFLYGHSLGGNLVIHYALRRLPRLAGIIATSPLFRTAVQSPAWKLHLLQALYPVWPGLTISSGLEIAALSRDDAVLQAYRDDPLVHDRISARLGMDMLTYGRWNLGHAADLPCPLLLMHGSADRITSARASREFAHQAGDACTLKIWEDCYHELHHEPVKEDMLAFALDWMSKIASLPELEHEGTALVGAGWRAR